MNKKLVIALILIVLLIIIFGIKSDFLKSENQKDVKNNQEFGLAYYPPGLGMYENYTKDAKTHQSKLGFTFQYPQHLYVTEFPDTDIPERLFVLDPLAEDDAYGIVISTALNDEGMTAEEWLLSENSGYLQSKDKYGDYQKFILDGQESVITDSGGWVVVNTPDNKYRLSIALLPGKNGNLLFTEMGVIVDSLRF